MKVFELEEILRKMPLNADVFLYDTYNDICGELAPHDIYYMKTKNSTREGVYIDICVE